MTHVTPQKIALIALRVSVSKELLKTAREFLYENTNCQVAEFAYPADCDNLRDWQPDGVLAHIHNAAILEFVLDLGVPVVNTSRVLHSVPIPTVSIDNREVGRLAAAHLLDLGYHHFGFIGNLNLAYSTERLEGFKSALPLDAATLSLYKERRPSYWEMQKGVRDPNLKAFQAWLKSFPPFSAIFTEDDSSALPTMEAMLDVGLQPGDDIGVISGQDMGVVSRPGITAVSFSIDRWGAEAARTLLAMIESDAKHANDKRVPPDQVITRDSTRFVGSSDPDVQTAVAFIHDNAHVDITVDHVADGAGVAKRTLQRKFKDQLDRTIADEIKRAHVEIAKRILLEENLPLSEVCRRCGLGSDEHRLIRVFKSREGITPGQFRRRHRAAVN